jgi:hypothetical protein
VPGQQVTNPRVTQYRKTEQKPGSGRETHAYIHLGNRRGRGQAASSEPTNRGRARRGGGNGGQAVKERAGAPGLCIACAGPAGCPATSTPSNDQRHQHAVSAPGGTDGRRAQQASGLARAGAVVGG